MKLLADMGVSRTTVQLVVRAGYDFVHLRDQRLQRLPDSAIVQKALREDRVIVTFDLDFGALLAASGAPAPSLILFRTSRNIPVATADRLLDAIARYRNELASGVIIIVEDTRTRARLLPVH